MRRWTFAELLLLARLCDVSYLADTKTATESLGFTWLDQVGNEQCQATVARWPATATRRQMVVVTIRGTQINQCLSIPELWDDVDGTSIELHDGLRVACGFWSPLAALWPQIDASIGSECPLITGHSLGGARAHLARLLCRNAEVVTFGAPCAAAVETWWWAYSCASPPYRVVHARDFAPAWRPGGPVQWVQPGPMLHITGPQPDGVPAKAETAYRRSGTNFSVADHSINRGYIPALEALAAAEVIS